MLRVARASRLLSLQQSRYFSCSPRGLAVDEAELRTKLTGRKLPLLFDELSPKPEILLRHTLSEFHPGSKGHTDLLRIEDKAPWQDSLRPGHHLIYFPPASRLSELLPDGTDPEQSPGDPFVRRMWAGGKLTFPAGTSILTDGSLQCCLERISDVKVKGTEGDEKIFVTIERRVSRSETQLLLAERSREALWQELSDDGNCGVIEERNIVFMKERPFEQRALTAEAKGKVVKAASKADHEHVYKPSRALLFRFSALTWNAHSIHLDRSYCKEVEGHRSMLVHGPLSLVMLLDFFGHHLKKGSQIATFEYRNLAPLYSDEQCKLCMRTKENGEYELWIENLDGGLSVRGTGTVRKTA